MTSQNREFNQWRAVFDRQTARILTNETVTPNSTEGRRIIKAQRSLLNNRASRGGISKRRGPDRVGLFTDRAKAAAFLRLEGLHLVFRGQQGRRNASVQAQGSWALFRIQYERLSRR